ncbi:MAG: YigZ family protein [Clostridiaceae bacterium]|nr:YigZ family protein [Clostridiaceae bacterium]
MTSYNTVYQGGNGEIEEKKSRFIANVFPVETEEEAARIIEETKKKYWDARHNCYAFVLGAGGEITRCSDDGEPSGTAGRPILEVLTRKKLCNILVIVTRYFGGTLLGTGGLVRAYSQATQAGLDASRLICKEPGHIITVDTDYNGAGKLQYVAAKLQAAVLDTVYTEAVQMKLVAGDELCRQLVREITEATAGRASVQVSGQQIYFAQTDQGVQLFEG